MNKTNHGGSAFPMVLGDTPVSAGLTIRDWFAGQALAGGVQFYTYDGCTTERASYDAAAMAYGMADAMLKARTE